MPLTGALSFELSVALGSTELALVKEAVVELQWAAQATAVDAAAQTLYVFDAAVGAFVARGSLDLADLASNRLRATIDRAGHWLIATPTAPARCARAAVQGGAEPVPRAGILLTLPGGFSAARVDADELGSGCALLPEGTAYEARALGQLSGGAFVIAAGSIAAGASAACDELCAASPLSGEPISIGCVRGMISIPSISGPDITLTESDSTGEHPRVLPLNTSFCVEARVGAQLTIGPSLGTCTGGGVIAVSAPAVDGASCVAEGDCVDFGTIRCCTSIEGCGDGVDEDCDSVIDEGCTCGGGDCSWSTATARCCTTTDTCGTRGPFSDDCINYEPVVLPTTCPGANLELAGGSFESIAGCCRSSGECGLVVGSAGCIAAADVPLVWGSQATLASVECTP